MAAQPMPLNDKTPGLFGQGFVCRRGLPRLSPPYGQGGFGWVFVNVAAQPMPLNDKTPGLFGQGFVCRRGLPRLSPPYGQGGFGW
ncbi:MAG TPA: hypothetical protein PLT29_03815, partial [Bacteroidales bacterium]|nr:hypothetical protein [Bacteroidales bacterium]